MSWDKNTVVTSTVDSTIQVLERLGESYFLTVLGEVAGQGMNDSDGKIYSVRKLAYRDTVILEQMYETDDCDADDYFMSYEFPAISEPHDWPLIVREVVEEQEEMLIE